MMYKIGPARKDRETTIKSYSSRKLKGLGEEGPINRRARVGTGRCKAIRAIEMGELQIQQTERSQAPSETTSSFTEPSRAWVVRGRRAMRDG